MEVGFGDIEKTMNETLIPRQKVWTVAEKDNLHLLCANADHWHQGKTCTSSLIEAEMAEKFLRWVTQQPVAPYQRHWSPYPEKATSASRYRMLYSKGGDIALTISGTCGDHPRTNISTIVVHIL